MLLKKAGFRSVARCQAAALAQADINDEHQRGGVLGYGLRLGVRALRNWKPWPKASSVQSIMRLFVVLDDFGVDEGGFADFAFFMPLDFESMLFS